MQSQKVFLIIGILIVFIVAIGIGVGMALHSSPSQSKVELQQSQTLQSNNTPITESLNFPSQEYLEARAKVMRRVREHEFRKQSLGRSK